MYAAAGGLSLARRQERRNLKKQNSSGDAHARQAHAAHHAYKAPSTPLPPIPHSKTDLSRSHANLQPLKYLQHQQLHDQHHHQQQQQIVQNHNDRRLHEPLPDNQGHLGDRLPSYTELNGRITSFGSADITSESQQGKAAWQERDRERRASVAEAAVNHRIKATEAHRRWMKRNRIHDSSFGGSSSDDDEYPGGLYGHQSAAANALLYVGLGTIAIGLVIAFVGTGEKGFKTVELRLIGPSLIASGLLCCIVRIFLCVCPSRCLRRRHKHRHRHKKEDTLNAQYHQPGSKFNNHGLYENANKDGKVTENIALADQTSLLQKSAKKGVSILTSTVPDTTATATTTTTTSSGNHNRAKHHHQSPERGVVEATTLFLEHEKQSASHSTSIQPLCAPAPNIPNLITGSHSDDEDILDILRPSRQSQQYDNHLLDLELKQLDTSSFDICSFDSSNSHDKQSIINEKLGVPSATITRSKNCDNKITKQRTPMNVRPGSTTAVGVARSTGLVNPDPDAHQLEEELLLLAGELDAFPPSSKLVKSVVSSLERDELLQNEIVLSPAKLQQDSREP